jgi:chitin disaccharide deacetylase
MGNKRLIVNADDYGLSEGVNRGIARAHQSGILTSASLMVLAPAAASAADASRAMPDLDLGLHLDVGEWEFSNGEWKAVYERAALDDVTALKREVDSQIEMFESLVGTLPTHVDSHQHAHRKEPLRSIVVEKCRNLAIALRHFTPGVQYLGDFYGQDERGTSYAERVSPEFLVKLLSKIGDGTTELCCHPAAEVDFDGTYAEDRLSELDALCNPVVRAELRQREITLSSFKQIRRDQ